MKKLILCSLLISAYSMIMAQKVVDFTFVTSPQITWMTSGSKDVNNGKNRTTIDGEIPFYNIGLNVGGGVEYDLGNKNYLTGGIIYTGTFIDNTTNQTVTDNTTLNSLRIRLGFVF